MADLLKNEQDIILQEYSADYNDEIPGIMQIYLSITPQIHYTIQIDFKNYPEIPKVTLPPSLRKDLGEPNLFLSSLRKWNSQASPHVIELIRELEEFLNQIIRLNNEMEQVTMEFDAYMSGPYRLHVLLHSYKLKTYEFDIVYKKSTPPSLIFSPALEKILNQKELKTISIWPRSTLIDICREISKKIDYRTRILDELNELEKRGTYQKYIRRSQDGSLLIDLRIEIETGEYCEFRIRLGEGFPLTPPDFTLKNLSDEMVREDLTQLLLSYYNEWQHATTLVELLDDLTEFIKRKSKQICQICHSYKCPKCGKPIKTKIKGISGETECARKCDTCSAIFHRCCWIEQLKLTRKCPVCLAPKTSYL
ncbi:MAG: hypothetical protein ACTSQI_08425 [Candidatus Helarchaeota archaeon]